MTKIMCRRKCDNKKDGLCTLEDVNMSSEGCLSFKNSNMITWAGPLVFNEENKQYYIESFEISGPDLEGFKLVHSKYKGLGAASGFEVNEDGIGFDNIQGDFFVFIDSVELEDFLVCI